MVTVRMRQDVLGSPDGVQVNEYKQGEEYELPESLAEVFLREGWAEQDKQLRGPSERKGSGSEEDDPPAKPGSVRKSGRGKK